MFDARPSDGDHAEDELVALPHAAMRCLRACRCAENAIAQAFQSGHQKRHEPRLHVEYKRAEARARDLAREAR